jgi:hypothetical protein
MADSNPSSSIVMPISLSVSLAGFLAATLALLYLWHKYSGPGEFNLRGLQKKCRLSWLTNSALVEEPKWREGGELRGLSQ